MKIPCVVLDSNIYISSFFWGGKPTKVIKKAMEEEINIFISKDILKEITRVLTVKFDVSKEKTDEVIEAILLFTHLIEPNKKINIIIDDPTDNMILECAKACEANYIITGDKHLLDLGNFEKTEILNVSKFLEKY